MKSRKITDPAEEKFLRALVRDGSRARARRILDEAVERALRTLPRMDSTFTG